MSDDREVYLDDLPLADTGLAWEAACSIMFSEQHFYVRSRAEAHSIVRSIASQFTFDGEEPDIYRYLLAPADAVAARLRAYGYSESKLRQLWGRAQDETLVELPRTPYLGSVAFGPPGAWR